MISSTVSKLLADYLHQYPLPSFPIELAVENLLPGAKIQLPFGNGHHHLAPHDGALQMGIGIILKAIVLILRIGFFGGQLLKPNLKIVVQPRFIVINKNARG